MHQTSLSVTWKSPPQPVSQALVRSLPASVGSQTQLQGEKVLGFVLVRMFLLQEGLFLYRLKKEKREKSNQLRPLSSSVEEVTGGN